LPDATWSAALISRRIGATNRLAKFIPNQTAESSAISAISRNTDAKVIWIERRSES
jgi:hypothetical protein